MPAQAEMPYSNQQAKAVISSVAGKTPARMQEFSSKAMQMPRNGNSPVQGQTHVVVTSTLVVWVTVQEVHVLLAARIQLQMIAIVTSTGTAHLPVQQNYAGKMRMGSRNACHRTVAMVYVLVTIRHAQRVPQRACSASAH